ncbi:MAG: phosphoglycerate kinase [Candidatus Paceibacterota bacterium]
MKSITKIPKLENIPVLVRAALNVPVENGVVVNSFRLRKAIPTIEYLRKKHARVVLIGHIGEKGTETLEPVYQAMKEFVPGILFCSVTTGAKAREAVRNLPAGGVLMLENLRRDVGETKNSPQFAAALAELADVFVEDSFDVCHREHASVVGVPKLLAPYAGLQLLLEVEELTKALKPVSPSLAVIGGAKFSTKEPVLNALLNSYDRVFVGGALANDFMVASGHSVGKSLVSAGQDELGIRRLLKNPKLMLPIDEVVALPDQDVTKGNAVGLDDVPADKAVYDDGPKTIQALAALTSKAKTVLWNGPLGLYEKGFTGATEGLAKAIAVSDAYSILGGGDTVAAVEELNLSHRFSFISTGGGAMLDFLAKGTLPGIQVLD